MDNTSLSHHGIKGMKWGVRRFQNKDGYLTAAGKRRARENASDEPSHDDYKKAHSGKSVKSMSDAELRSRLNRLQLERQYKQLSSNDVNRGKEFVSKTMKAATGIATATTTAITTTMIRLRKSSVALSKSKRRSVVYGIIKHCRPQILRYVS